MTRNRLIIASALVLILATIGITLLIGYWSRNSLVTSQRAGCERGAVNLAGTVNVFRADAIGNRAIANDPRQSAATRKARRVEASIENRVALTQDLHIDRGVWLKLLDRRDQAVVKQGHFRCDVAYPRSSLIP